MNLRIKYQFPKIMFALVNMLMESVLGSSKEKFKHQAIGYINFRVMSLMEEANKALKDPLLHFN